jgi:hypothetical protein
MADLASQEIRNANEHHKLLCQEQMTSEVILGQAMTLRNTCSMLTQGNKSP